MTRRLIVLADGTWNTPRDEDEGKLAPTNVAKLHEAVRRRPVGADGVKQIPFYHPGVGVEPNIFEKAVITVADVLHIRTMNRNLFQGATGDGIDTNIKDCYRWLVDNYEDGDQLYFFGFSRGAYTVRSLAGLVRNSGLVTRGGAGLVDAAFALYRDRSDASSPRSDEAARFRAANAREVRIRCVGVWDTVGALGIPLGIFKGLNEQLYQFHDVTLSSWVDHAYHALAIDEHRRPFAPTLWQQQEEAKRGGQVMRQMWFTGAHSNVGGGYADCGLSDNSFRWVAEGAAAAGLDLDQGYVAKTICTGCWNGALRDSMNPIFQALGPIDREMAAGRTNAIVQRGAFDSTCERVHPTARDRLGKIAPLPTTPYAPANLASYIERHPVELPYS